MALFASKNIDQSIDLLSLLENVECKVRDSKLYAILPKLERVFNELDGGAIKTLPDRTKKYIKNALDDIADHCTKPEMSFLDFIIDRIMQMINDSGSRAIGSEAWELEYELRMLKAEIARASYELENGACDDVKITALNKEIRDKQSEYDEKYAEYQRIKGAPENGANSREPATPERDDDTFTPVRHTDNNGGANNDGASGRRTISINTDDNRTKGVHTDADRLVHNMQGFHYPQDASQIMQLMEFIIHNVVSVPEKELTSLLTRWAREADENGTSESRDRFLRRIGDCAKKYDSRNSTTVFRNVWRSVDAVLTEYDDCKKLLYSDSGTREYGELMTHIVPYFRKNPERACGFFINEVLDIAQKSGGNVVSSAWNKIICDPQINAALKEGARGNYYFGDGKRYLRKLKGIAKKYNLQTPDAMRERDDVSGKRTIIFGGAVVALFLIAMVVYFAMQNFTNTSINKDTIVFNYPDSVTLNCGEAFELSGGTISYQTNNGESFTVDITDAVIKSPAFNPNKVGEQTVVITYGGKDYRIKVTVMPLTLETPNPSFSYGKITWSAIEGVGEYELNVTDPDGNHITTAKLTADATEWQVPDSIGYGAYVATVAAKSTQQKYVDSGVSNTVAFEKREGVTEITYDDGAITWNAIAGASSYRVTLNGEVLAANSNSIERALIGGNNEITVSVLYAGNVVYTDKTVIIKKLKLESSDLSVNNNRIIYDTSANIVLYLDGEVFDGDLSKITTPGDYFLTAKRFASKDGEIDSDTLEAITLTKLPLPLISISDNALHVQEGYDVIWYLNGTQFSGNILDVSDVGTYEVTAKFKGADKYVIDSELSAAVTFTKLAIPTIIYDPFSKMVNVQDTSVNYELYLNGEVFDGNVANLGEGYFKVTARNVGDGKSSISSAESSAFYITNIDASITVADSGQGYANVYLDTDIANVKYSLVIVYYQGENNIGTSSSENLTDKVQKVYYNRGGKVADRMEITIIMYPPSGEYEQKTITYTWTKA